MMNSLPTSQKIILPDCSAADAVLPDDVVEQVEHHVSRQNGEDNVGHSFARILPPVTKIYS